MTEENTFYKFIEYLEDRGLLTKSPDSFDYEKVIWEYLHKSRI